MYLQYLLTTMCVLYRGVRVLSGECPLREGPLYSVCWDTVGYPACTGGAGNQCLWNQHVHGLLNPDFCVWYDTLMCVVCDSTCLSPVSAVLCPGM